ncbi:hypothetical protein EXIGLDRAFT_706570 [Exidia glandulosa HHB12029]|uniref:Fungal-type protein kinase domain-containing protein n=1 Tax=Exidia glandulosa HHB12029 TaxID=1314781 RepID=A0A165PM19_EXIGL|nr:hypothetical protein EXIGLDRAFT_706570 [Exidia glandulosa HHB12029]
MSLVALAARRGAALARSRCPVPALPLRGQRLASTANRDNDQHVHDENDRALVYAIDKDYLAWATATVGMPASRLSALQRNPDIRAALDAVSPKEDEQSKVLEASMYGPVTRILNEVSLEFAKDREARGVGDSSAIVCMSTGNHQALGAYLNDIIKLDYSSRTVPFNVLKDLVERARETDKLPKVPTPKGPQQHQPSMPSLSMPSLSSIVGPGEQKRLRQISYKQAKSYMEAVKRYRVDLHTVHGFQVSKDQIVLASLNACGTWISPTFPVSDIRPWVAHMGLLYHAHDTRMPELQYRSEQLQFPRWDMSFGERRRAMVPFWASRPPGRSTWAGFVLPQTPHSGDEAAMDHSFRNEAVQRFRKVSLQDVRSCSHEADLLQRLHTPKYLAGVVRPTFAYRDGDHKAITARGSTVERVMHVLELGSIGKPLSQARSPRHLLYIMYDLIKVLRALSEKNVLHRDVSWYNTLIDPIHTVDDGRGVERHGCISQVMFATGLDVTDRPFVRKAGSAGAAGFESCALLADFDLSVDETTSDDTLRRERTGTPMFIAVERLNPEDCTFNVLLSRRRLLANLSEVENSDKGRKAFNAAFPAGDGGFMDSFKGMIDEECERRDRDETEPINRNGKHEPRHDVESAWWVFLWAFARALPRGLAPTAGTDAEWREFNGFCKVMLFHSAQSDDWAAARARFLFFANIKWLFHPRLVGFEKLFKALASYLSIPWHLYSDMPHDHAHTACERLILAALVSDNDALDVELDTEQPRVTTALDDRASLIGMSSHRRTDPGNRPPDFIAASVAQAAPNVDRTLSAENIDTLEEATYNEADSAAELAPDYVPPLVADEDVRPNVDGPSPVAGRQTRRKKQPTDDDVYRHDRDLDSWTARILRVVVWKDKALWFGSGRRTR